MNTEQTVKAYLEDGTEVTVSLTPPPPPEPKKVKIRDIEPGQWYTYTYTNRLGRQYMVMNDGFGQRMEYKQNRVWTEASNGKRSTGDLDAKVYLCDKDGNLL